MEFRDLKKQYQELSVPVSAAEHRSLKHTAGVNPVRKGLASHRYSALEGIGRVDSIAIFGILSIPIFRIEKDMVSRLLRKGTF